MNRPLEKECKFAWNRIIPGAERFVNSLDGTAVLDRETGLVWAKSPVFEKTTWYGALDYCANLTLGKRKGWRLPAIEELASLVDPANHDPALPSGHPFINIQSSYYWSSTTYVVDDRNALIVFMRNGDVGFQFVKDQNQFNVWPVRGRL